MRKHKINIEASGNKKKLISFLETTIKIIKLAQDKGAETLSGAMSNTKMNCTIENL